MDYYDFREKISKVRELIGTDMEGALEAYREFGEPIKIGKARSALTSLIQTTPRLMLLARGQQHPDLATDLFIAMNTIFEYATGTRTGDGIILTEHFAAFQADPETHRATWFIPSKRKLPSGDEMSLNICNDRFVANIHDILRQVKRIAPSLESHYGQVIIQARTIRTAWKNIADYRLSDDDAFNALEEVARKMENRGKSVTVMDFPGPVPKPR